MKLTELFSDVLPLIQKVAPTIGAAIGGPIGLAAGYVIPVLANAFDAHPTNVKQLVSNILADPNAQSKLQDIESEHANWLSSLMDSVNNLSHAEVNIKLDWQSPLRT